MKNFDKKWFESIQKRWIYFEKINFFKFFNDKISKKINIFKIQIKLKKLKKRKVAGFMFKNNKNCALIFVGFIIFVFEYSQ